MTNSDYAVKLERLHMEMMVGNIMRIFIVLAAVLVMLEFILHRHGKIEIENLVLFPAIFALAGALIVTILALILKFLLTRTTHYYGDMDEGDKNG